MKTEWDYTQLAKAYLKRPAYAGSAIDAMCAMMGLNKGDKVCDIGAGVGHLTIELVNRGMDVTAVEPNDEMRFYGKERTETLPHCEWFEGVGEDTRQESGKFDGVTFGSSFNVCDQMKALAESKRILKPNHWFACMWNHRDLKDPLQKEIEAIIMSYIPNYDYGNRRADQTAFLNSSGFFSEVNKIEGQVFHQITKEECVEAWRSHATLERQANGKFAEIIADIETLLDSKKDSKIVVPYTTHIWVAKFK